jgi:hypothetical protein
MLPQPRDRATDSAATTAADDDDEENPDNVRGDDEDLDDMDLADASVLCADSPPSDNEEWQDVCTVSESVRRMQSMHEKQRRMQEELKKLELSLSSMVKQVQSKVQPALEKTTSERACRDSSEQGQSQLLFSRFELGFVFLLHLVKRRPDTAACVGTGAEAEEGDSGTGRVAEDPARRA